MPKKFRGLTHRQLRLLALYGSVESWEWDNTMFDGVSPYELEKRLREGVGGVAGFGRSSIYTASKKLAAEGYLDAHEFEREDHRDDDDDGSRRRSPIGERTTVYTITKDGASLVEAWLLTSCNVPEINDEAGVRLEVGRYSLEAVLEGLLAMRPALKTLARRIDEAEEKLRSGDPTVALQYGLYRALTDARLKWLDNAERVLGKTIRERKRVERAAEKKRDRENQEWEKQRRGH